MQQLAGLVLLAEGVFQLAQTLSCLAIMAGTACPYSADLIDALSAIMSSNSTAAGAGSAIRKDIGIAFSDIASSPLRRGA